jgi:type I restriction enzyme, R subunit
LRTGESSRGWLRPRAGEKLAELLADKTTLDVELQRLRTEVAAAKKANASWPDEHNYSEAETRDYFIDLLLKEAGWGSITNATGNPQWKACPAARGRGSSIMCSGVMTGFLWRWWKPNAPSATRASVSGRRSCTLTVWKKLFDRRPIIFYSNGYEHWIGCVLK